METTNINSRIYGLDIMRAAAIIFVMLSHGFVYSGNIVSGVYSRWLMLDGVGLFFVLSGFLIGEILIRKIEEHDFNSKQLVNFWIRRWLRTLPAYFFVLTFLIVCYYAIHKELPPVWYKYFLFTQNFASAHPLFFGEAWSLSVEEWFYILFPFLLFLILQFSGRKSRLIMICIIFVLLTIFLTRLYKVGKDDFLIHKNFGDEIMKVVIIRMDAIMYGVLGAWLCFYAEDSFYKYKHLLFAIGLVLLISSNIIRYDFFYTVIRPTVLPLAALCLLPELNSLKVGKGKRFRIITFISMISYSMYLTNHMIVQRGIMPFITKALSFDLEKNVVHNLIAYILFWMITIVVAYALYRLIERPFMNLRNKFKTD